MTDRPLLTARTVGETENALRALLIRTLVGTGLDYPRWVVLTVVARSQSSISATELVARLSRSLKIDDVDAIALIDDLRAPVRHRPHAGRRAVVR